MKTKKVKGFTLIELIVVIAIIAVLAAILIPSLMGYVGKASLRTANANAKAVATNSATILSDLEAEGVYLNVTAGSTASSAVRTAEGGLTFTGTVKVDGKDTTVDEAYFAEAVEKAAGLKSGSRWQVQFDDTGDVVAAVYAKDTGNSYIGTWPTESTSKNQYSSGFDAAMKGAVKTPATT